MFLNQIVTTFLIFIFPISLFAQGAMPVNQKCANKPNCVSSFDERKDFFYPPLEGVEGPWEGLKNKIESNLKSFSKVKVHESKDNYLHLIVTTSIMKFKDDVYFWWNPQLKTLSMKSESRVGHWDIGANKKRLNRFVKNWN